MKQNQTEKHRTYVSPQCETVQTAPEQLICVSVRTNAGGSTAPAANTGWEDKGEHDMGTVFFGDPSSVAPAKEGWFDNEEDL